MLAGRERAEVITFTLAYPDMSDREAKRISVELKLSQFPMHISSAKISVTVAPKTVVTVNIFHISFITCYAFLNLFKGYLCIFFTGFASYIRIKTKILENLSAIIHQNQTGYNLCRKIV